LRCFPATQPNNQFNQNLPELALIEGTRQVASKPDVSLSPSFFTFRSRFVAVQQHWYYEFVTARVTFPVVDKA
jgi:hypothetical protein